MANPNIRLKRSAVSGKRPTGVQLPLGELALNTYDAQLFAQVDTGGVGIGTTVISLTPWKESFGAESIYYNNSVGIGTNNATEKLTVLGDASISSGFTVSGISTFQENVYIDKAVSVAGSTGQDGQYLISTGIGLTWKTLTNEDLAIMRTSFDYAATEGQTTFNVEYTAGYVDVYVNGVLLSPAEYTASNGTSIVLGEALFVDDVVQIVAYNPYTVISSSGAISAGGTTGTSGQYLKSTGVGIEWEDFPTLRSETNYTATEGQTTFTVNYNVGFIDVYVNGVRLTAAEYTASNGTSIVLGEALFVGDNVDILTYNTTSGGGGGGGGSETDTLDSVTGRGSTTTNNVGVGNITATSFIKSSNSGGFLKADGTEDTTAYLSEYTESDTLDTVVGRGSNTAAPIQVGELTSLGDLYTDTIRRYTNNSTTTKIALESNSLRLFAGNGVTPKIRINGNVGINTDLSVTGTSSFSDPIKVGIVTGITSGSTIEFKDPADFLRQVSFGSDIDVPLGILTVGSGNTTVVVGGATTELVVNGDARITGILTIGTSSITLNGSTDTITATTFSGNATSATTATSATSATTAGSATSISVGGSAVIGINTSGGLGNSIEFHTDNGTNIQSRWRITPQGNLLPSANDSYDIGSAEYKVRDMYVNDGSIHTESGKTLSFYEGILTWGDDPVVLKSEIKAIVAASTSFKDFKKRIANW